MGNTTSRNLIKYILKSTCQDKICYFVVNPPFTANCLCLNIKNMKHKNEIKLHFTQTHSHNRPTEFMCPLSISESTQS